MKRKHEPLEKVILSSNNPETWYIYVSELIARRLPVLLTILIEKPIVDFKIEMELSDYPIVPLYFRLVISDPLPLKVPIQAMEMFVYKKGDCVDKQKFPFNTTTMQFEMKKFIEYYVFGKGRPDQ